MALSGMIQPVVNLPQKPPPARSSYFPVCIGGGSSAQALNFSHVGLQNTEQFSRIIVEIHALLLTNNTAGALTYVIRRMNGPITGIVFTGAVIPYADAGSSPLASLGLQTKNDAITVSGTRIGEVVVGANDHVVLPFAGVVNNGALIVSGSVVNQRVDAMFFARAYPIIFPQKAG